MVDIGGRDMRPIMRAMLQEPGVFLRQEICLDDGEGHFDHVIIYEGEQIQFHNCIAEDQARLLISNYPHCCSCHYQWPDGSKNQLGGVAYWGGSFDPQREEYYDSSEYKIEQLAIRWAQAHGFGSTSVAA